MKKFLEAIPVIGIFVLLLGPSAYYKQWWLFAVFLVFGVIFGIIEVVSVKVSGKSVSQHVWALKRKNPKSVYIITATMLIAWLLLIAHFLMHD